MRSDIIVPAGPADQTLAHMADPSRDIRRGLVIAALFFVGFLGWAAFIRLDAAAYATGSMIVSGQRQSVQHRDGGVVGAIFVKEGQRVQRDQLLLSLAAAEVRAQERALASQSIRLLAQRSRLEAEQMDRQTLLRPVEFAALSPEDQTEAALAMTLQQSELSARRAVLLARRDVLRQQAGQAGDQGRGYGEQALSSREQIRLINDQISALQPLADKGFVSQTRMRELERMRAELTGRQGQYIAGQAQTRGAAREADIEALEAVSSFRERTASDLRDVETRLGEILPKWHAARDQLRRIEIRAPATGAVVGLNVFTPGGVITPGQKLMDIVPERQPLRVQMRISPDDADDLHVGQSVLVKFTGLHDRTLLNLSGRMTRLSADSFTDEHTGLSYFTGEAEIGNDQLNMIRQVRGRNFELRPGMPVQILVPLKKRTALDYALEPLIGSFWSSFREH